MKHPCKDCYIYHSFTVVSVCGVCLPGHQNTTLTSRMEKNTDRSPDYSLLKRAPSVTMVVKMTSVQLMNFSRTGQRMKPAHFLSRSRRERTEKVTEKHHNSSEDEIGSLGQGWWPCCCFKDRQKTERRGETEAKQNKTAQLFLWETLAGWTFSSKSNKNLLILPPVYYFSFRLALGLMFCQDTLLT